MKQKVDKQDKKVGKGGRGVDPPAPGGRGKKLPALKKKQ